MENDIVLIENLRKIKVKIEELNNYYFDLYNIVNDALLVDGHTYKEDVFDNLKECNDYIISDINYIIK